jgi:hypothetical protein
MSIDRSEFLQQFMEWTDDDLEKLAEESDYQTFLSVFKVLSQEVAVRAKGLAHQKQRIMEVEEELDNAKGNLDKLLEIEGKHKEKRKKYEQEGKKLEQKMVECKAKWKKIQL